MRFLSAQMHFLSLLFSPCLLLFSPLLLLESSLIVLTVFLRDKTIRMTKSQKRKYWKKSAHWLRFVHMSLLGLLALTDPENTGVGGERKEREIERERELVGGVGFSWDFKLWETVQVNIWDNHVTSLITGTSVLRFNSSRIKRLVLVLLFFTSLSYLFLIPCRLVFESADLFIYDCSSWKQTFRECRKWKRSKRIHQKKRGKRGGGERGGEFIWIMSSSDLGLAQCSLNLSLLQKSGSESACANVSTECERQRNIKEYSVLQVK